MCVRSLCLLAELAEFSFMGEFLNCGNVLLEAAELFR